MDKDTLKEQGRGGSGGTRATVSGALVVAQVALSLVLVVAAGLFVRTFARLASLPLGFDSDRVLVVNVNATRAHIDPSTRVPFYHRLADAVAAVPGVAGVASHVVDDATLSSQVAEVLATDARSAGIPPGYEVAAMNGHLALKIGYLLRRSNEPVAGFKKTDNTTTASVVLRWRAAATMP